MHLGSRHELARQRRREKAVGSILGDELREELFGELHAYERAIAEHRRERGMLREISRTERLKKQRNKQIIKSTKKYKNQRDTPMPESIVDLENEKAAVPEKSGVPSDPALARALCARRVAARTKLEREKVALKHEEEKSLKALEVSDFGKKAMFHAKERIRLRARRRKEIAEEELSDLILRIPSSVEATNMTRLLDPAFQPEFAYNKACTKEDEERVWSLMSF